GLDQRGGRRRRELVAGDGGEPGVDVLHEVERLAVEEHVLLLDAERIRVALAVGVVEHAAAGREAAALAGDRRWIDLRHARTIFPKRRMANTSGSPMRIVASIFATYCPFTRSSFPVPNAIEMKTSESIGEETRFVPTTRTASGTRSRAQAPSTL